MDVSEMHDSSVDSMAHAIENAQCVLMWVTEKCRQSTNCQSEAKYVKPNNLVYLFFYLEMLRTQIY